jgi:hypothetical protein
MKPAVKLAKLQSEIMALNVSLSHALCAVWPEWGAILQFVAQIAAKKAEAAQAFALVNA